VGPSSEKWVRSHSAGSEEPMESKSIKMGFESHFDCYLVMEDGDDDCWIHGGKIGSHFPFSHTRTVALWDSHSGVRIQRSQHWIKREIFITLWIGTNGVPWKAGAILENHSRDAPHSFNPLAVQSLNQKSSNHPCTPLACSNTTNDAIDGCSVRGVC